MTETLLTPSVIKLYGRVVTDIYTWHTAKLAAIAAGATAPNWDAAVPPPTYPLLGVNRFVQNQLNSTAATTSGGYANLARIYGFSFEGTYYDLPKPAIFLVHGPGADMDVGKNSQHTTLETSGVMARDWE